MLLNRQLLHELLQEAQQNHEPITAFNEAHGFPTTEALTLRQYQMDLIKLSTFPFIRLGSPGWTS